MTLFNKLEIQAATLSSRTFTLTSLLWGCSNATQLLCNENQVAIRSLQTAAPPHRRPVNSPFLLALTTLGLHCRWRLCTFIPNLHFFFFLSPPHFVVSLFLCTEEKVSFVKFHSSHTVPGVHFRPWETQPSDLPPSIFITQSQCFRQRLRQAERRTCSSTWC